MRREIFGFFLILLFIGMTSASYTLSNPKLVQQQGVGFNGYFDGESSFAPMDSSVCRDGQDFVLQINPAGCDPPIVRTDLLEEQDVAVFCPIQAVKTNPLIDLRAIDSLSFSGDFPQEVRSVGFLPSKDALGGERRLNEMSWNNIGYATIFLRQQKNSSALRNCENNGLGEVCWIEGNMSVNIKYDIRGGFGIRTHKFYLPVMDDEKFSKRYGQYEFFNKRGFLRAEDVGEDSATIVVYSGLLDNPYKAGSNSKSRFASFNLNVGEESSKVYLPGMDCISGVVFKLDGVDKVDVVSKLNINSDYYELREGEEFLNGACKIISSEEYGFIQRTKIYCRGDDKTETFELSFSPKIRLKIDGKYDDYKIGQRLYKSGEDVVYLGYAGYNSDGEYSALLVSLDKDVSFLSEEETGVLSYLYDAKEGGESALDMIKGLSGELVAFWSYIKDGTKREFVNSVESEAFGKKVLIEGLGEGVNDELDGATRSNYNKAISDYDKILNDFSEERYPENDLSNLGERAAFSKIKLSWELSQKADLAEFCSDFSRDYSNSLLDVSMYCSNPVYEASSDGISAKDILVNGDYKRIFFEGVSRPGYNDYGAEILVEKKNGEREVYFMRKNMKIYLNSDEGNDFIMLEDLDDDYAKIKVSVENRDYLTLQGAKSAIISDSYILEKNSPKSFSSDYVFTLRKVNLKKAARVSVLPSVENMGSKAKFPFRIGVEKRSIQLLPEKIEKRIDYLNKTIEKWERVSSGLDGVVSGMKKACVAAGGALTFKNVIAGANGKTIARGEVMRGAGGWYEKCSDMVEEGVYSNIDQCYLKNAKEIDDDVDMYYDYMKDQDKKIKDIKDGLEKVDNPYGKDSYDPKELADKYSSVVLSSLSKYNGEVPNPDKTRDDVVNMDLVKKYLNSDGFSKGVYSIDDLKKVDLYYSLLEEDPDNAIYSKRLYLALKQLEINAESVSSLENSDETAEEIGISGMSPRIGLSEDIKSVEPYDGGVANKKIGDIEKGERIQWVIFDRVDYIFTLRGNGADRFVIKEIYNISGKKVEDEEVRKKIFSHYGIFKKFDKDVYNNVYKNPVVKYYETEPYKGSPAVVPVRIEGGWYAYIKHTVPVLGNLRVYDESERVNSFYLCNVGKNGIEEFNLAESDDICRLINLQFGDYNQFPGLEESETASLVKDANDAIFEASRGYENGAKSIKIGTDRIRVGSPALDLPVTQCADFMSPKECKLLFNLCDPVICPSSRCDFGGAYPVRDVIQSGIIGSMALCLPNAKEGIVMPVCLSGVKAGIDGLTSVFQAYEDCLQTSLDSGETVGVCDEMYSVYMCEFFWKQGIPIAKLGAEKIMSSLLGQGMRGGGEYMGVQAAFKNAEDSVSFFVDNYAVNSFKAFRARSQDEIGSDVCKKFVSMSYPKGQGVLDVLTEADSPSQFYAKFDEAVYSTATNPPTSKYKVWYHIYAGDDRGAYYKVYLRGADGSYYQDTMVGRQVASGYIKRGGYADEAVDFVAPSGYKELCVQVNDQIECGFGQSTSNFAMNYMKDQYLKKQIENKNIDSEKECVSGSASLYNVIDLNVQAGLEDAISPELYNKGVIRTCATDNPGIGTDNYVGGEGQRWVPVGNCGSEKMKCWLDTDSLDGTFNFDSIKDKTLEDVSKNYLDQFVDDNDYLDNDFEGVLNNLSKINDFSNRVVKITEYLKKVFLSSNKAYLYFLRAESWGNMTMKSKLVDAEEGGETFVDNTGKEEICEIVEESENVVEIADARDKVMAVAKENEGKLVPGKSSCYTAVKYIYDLAGVYHSGEGGKACQYSDGPGAEYTISGKLVSLGENLLPKSSSCSIGKRVDEKNKLDGLRKGDMIGYVWSNSPAYHNSIFVRWVDKENYVAELFDWNGGYVKKGEKSASGELCEGDFIQNPASDEDKQYCKIYRYFETSLKDSDHAVYMYWIPKIKESGSVEEVVSDNSNLPEGEVVDNKGVLENKDDVSGLSPGDRLENVLGDLSVFSTSEVVAFLNAESCDACGDGAFNICDEKECGALDKLIPGGCDYSDGLFSGECSPSENRVSCEDKESCQKVLAQEIMKTISYDPAVIRNDFIKEDTGYKNFECLAVGIAYTESRIKFCNEYEKDSNPLYCEGDRESVLTNPKTKADWGIMQLNKKYSTEKEQLYFVDNVKNAEEKLRKLYYNFNKNYGRTKAEQGKYYKCTDKTYSGWQYVLRGYNGWGSNCNSGNVNYVEDVLANRKFVEGLGIGC